MLAAYDQPPVLMPMPETLERNLTILFAVTAAVALIAALMAWHRFRTPIYPLLVLGSLLCTFNEPWLDIPAKIWHPRSDNFHLFDVFGRPMPLWVPLCYTLFFGALPGILYYVVRRGLSYRTAWISVGCFGLLNLVVEVSVTGPDRLYTYYGYQPFAIGDWGIAQLVTNGTGVVGIVYVLQKAPHLFEGTRVLLLVPLVPTAQMASLAVGIPGFWAINMEIDHVWQWLAMGVTLASGLALINAMIRDLTGHPRAASAVEQSGVQTGVEERLSRV